MKFFISLTLTLLWFAFMTFLSHQDGEHTSRTSLELAERLSFLEKDTERLNCALRRLAHVGVYAVLAVLFVCTLRLGRLPRWPAAALIFWAWADEATKRWIQGRHFSWLDVALNLLGTLLGAAAGIVVRSVLTDKREKYYDSKVSAGPRGAAGGNGGRWGAMGGGGG